MNEVFATKAQYPGTVSGAQPYAPPVADPRDTGHYGQALQEQDKLVSVLQDEVQMLRGRLEPMLRPSVPTPGEAHGNSTSAPSVSPLTGVAQTTNVKLHSLVIQIRDLAARFDL